MPTSKSNPFATVSGLLIQPFGTMRAAKGLTGGKRAGLVVALALAVMVFAPARSAQQVCSSELKPECPALGVRFELAFVIDSSGSLAVDQRGQTYNVEVDGEASSLRDLRVIPRDGSTAVAVVAFAGDARLVSPLKQISSEADAEAVAAVVEGLRCPTENCTPAGACPAFGFLPASNYGPAISLAATHLLDNHRAGARQAILLSSDGQPTDFEIALRASDRARSVASSLGIPLELDLILLAADSPQQLVCGDALVNVNQIVFPQSACDLPGATLPVRKGDSNKPCASITNAAVRADFDLQVKAFAEHTRSILRSAVTTLAPLIVNTEADPDSNTPILDGSLSLRQAIELANCNGGAATITFDCAVKTIRPRIALPALIAPEIRIDGLSGRDKAGCSPTVTIDGSSTLLAQSPHERNDGILIRSNLDQVLGLAIINFKRAGVGVEPVCQSDNVGFNLIERNTFQGNGRAGVCVVDPPQNPANAISHNIGNTISMNNIASSGTPIDLSLTSPDLDGPTPNDPGDEDQGPNTLLNFPERLTAPGTLDVAAQANEVTLTGQLSEPASGGATVEIFAITSFRPVSSGRAIDGVTFLARTTASATGAFVVSGLGDSPTCGYTATVTDLAGNTSELMFPCGGFPQAKVSNLDFGDAAAPNSSPKTGSFTIENVGCAPLDVHFESITRDGFLPKRRNNDNGRFSIQTVGVGSDGQTTTIQPGETQSFTASLDLTIPGFPGAGKAPRAFQTLPNNIASTLSFAKQRCGPNTVSLTGKVTTEVHLIDPVNTRRTPLVTLVRNGDELVVGYSVFDSDLSVRTVNYEFFKVQDGQCQVGDSAVPVDIFDPDLTATIRARGVVTGQSFNVIQRFLRAKKHPEAGCVRVTVSDGPTSASATSLPASGPSVAAALESQGISGPGWTTIVRPALKLPDPRRASHATKSSRTADNTRGKETRR